jgi:hypothetical protein
MALKIAAAAGTHKSSDTRNGVWVTTDDKKRDTYVTREAESEETAAETKGNAFFRF